MVVLAFVPCQASTNGFSKMKASDFFASAPAIALVEAAAWGKTGRIDELLAQGLDVNTTGKDGITPLIWALIKENKTGFRHLLVKGAKPNLQVLQGESALSFAAKNSDPDFLRIVLKHGGNPNLVNPRTNQTPIYDSMDHRRFENVSVLIKGGADLNFRNRSGVTPPIRAAVTNQYQVVFEMLNAGADPKVKDNWGKELIYYLKDRDLDPKHDLYRWRSKVIELLKERGVSVD
jgi:ankyrin repeat protein